jgi:glycosyltransferase involved in cell wall biosynthesis
MKTIAVVIPFLDEEDNIPEMYRRLDAMFARMPEQGKFLFVDDGSTDGSVAWLEQQAKADPRVQVIELSRNYGHQIAITAGMDHSDADATVIIDCDLQDPPEVIAELAAKWRDGCEVVYAVRDSREGETWLKKFLAASFYKLFRNLVKVPIPANTGDFRLVDRKVVDALREVRELHRFMRGLTCWVGYRQCGVHYHRAARHAGSTKYPVWKSLRLAFDAITSFSAAPLRWMTGMGVLVAFCGGLQTLSIVWRKVFRPESLVQGWATLAALILLLGGLQLVCLGLIGQYVSRIFEESKRRPLYFLKSGRTETSRAAADDVR